VNELIAPPPIKKSPTQPSPQIPSRLLLKDVLQKTTLFFREKGIETARLDAELLIAAALNWERMKIYLNYEYPMNDSELALCREHVRRRASGEPVAYILGKRDFYKHSFKVSNAVLIPRPETEHVVEDAVVWLRSQLPATGEQPANALPLKVVDFGTGSGCIGLSILAEIPECQLVAIDISSGALEIANENAVKIGVSERVHFIEADVGQLEIANVTSALGGLADAVVANPPYISVDDPMIEANVKLFEPTQALFSGEHGLVHLRSWCAKAGDLLRPKGWIMFEIGNQQGAAARQIFEDSCQFRDIEIVKDLSGRERFVRAFRAVK
jgi:release factor glutamine methyltransferase